MLPYRNFKKTTVVSLMALTLVVSACSSNDDDDDSTDVIDSVTDVDGDNDETSQVNDNITAFSVVLDSSQSQQSPTIDGFTPAATGEISVDTTTGAATGSITVTESTSPVTMAHIHEGAAGATGDVLLPLSDAGDGVWTLAEGATFDTAGLAAFVAGNTYFNVHTENNGSGEIRGQLVDAAVPAPGSITITFTNNAESQPMTPPVVALHNAPDSEAPIRMFAVGEQALDQVIAIAENGDNAPMVALLEGQAELDTPTVSASGVAFGAVEGPIFPGDTASITLDVESDDQVLSVVSMVICTNDAFTGVDSHVLSADATETFNLAVYDAGSETNVESLEYWVPPCNAFAGDNLGDEEGGVITAHPGQGDVDFSFGDSGVTSNAAFPAGAELMEVTITRN